MLDLHATKPITYAAAARALGMNPKTYENWRREDKDFKAAIEAARQSFLTKQAGNIAKAGDEGEWRASAHVLEHMDPENWGKKVTVRHEIVLELPSLLEGPASDPDFDWEAYEAFVKEKRLRAEAVEATIVDGPRDTEGEAGESGED